MRDSNTRESREKVAQRIRNIYLIAWTLALEAWRRREIYVIVFVTTVLIAGLRFARFFDMEDLGKFYREVSLKTMNLTTAAAVILLAARQLPREFSSRTIYPLLAKPVTRLEFLIGKYMGVLFAGMFCYGLFMIVFGIASATLRAPVEPHLFLQAIYLQVLSLAVLGSLVFFLSMVMHADAAVTLAAILFIASQVLMNLMSYLYDYVGDAARAGLLSLHFIIPQLTLFDLSAKVIHSMKGQVVVWGPLESVTMWKLTAYAAAYTAIFLGAAFFFFRRKPL